MAASHSGRKNRLANEISPYLLLHQHNPVDWYPWGEEALTRARQENKPIFLSVGYSTCYWCHVMERESFADAGTAAMMNEHFINIKVDREERPELDEIYMAATQILTHQGGWPNSLFLTPELRPYFAGTYFPLRDVADRPSFRTVLLSMHRAWLERQQDVQMQAQELSEAMSRMLEERGEPSANLPAPASAERSMEALAGRYDAEHGGFGEAPKFPSPANLFLLSELAPENPQAAEMLRHTLDRMARGGIYDQLAGGFHRYATDREWRVPHFEKMLYDNGILLELYAAEHLRTGEPEWARVALEIAGFLQRELTSPEGGLYSAIDAEVGGKEGAYHVWTLHDLSEALGPEDAAFLAEIFGYDSPPFFEGESYVLYLPSSYEDLAGRRRLSTAQLLEQVEPLKQRLLSARQLRRQPLVDDKVLADWNGMAITGLATLAAATGHSEILQQAQQAATFVLQHLRDQEGTLCHSWREGQARFAAYLSDYVYLTRGLLALHRADPSGGWLMEAERITEQQVDRLADPKGGFFGAGAQPDVLFRSKEIFDGALPAVNSVAALNLLELAQIGSQPEKWRELAETTLKAFGPFTERQPEGARMMTIAALRHSRSYGTSPNSGVDGATTADPVVEQALSLVSVRVDSGEVYEDGWQLVKLQIDVAEDWYLGASEAAVGRHATSLTALAGSLRAINYPVGENLEGTSESPRCYRGSFEITVEVKPSEGNEILLGLSYQACGDQHCLVPVALEIPVTLSTFGSTSAVE